MDEIFWQPGMTLADSEKRILQRALRFCEYNQTKTAQMLGISVKTVANKIKEYSLEVARKPVVHETYGS